ncbi:MAG: hypothetical protein OIN87_08615 [Candidatus Methanoperedens sp.]|nr:hypothetical protein [Candidatus Methanoperedens sp.]
MDESEEIHKQVIGFQAEIANVQTAIADFECGHNLNIAIIGEPYSGKTSLINEIERMNPDKVSRISLSSIILDRNEIQIAEESKRVFLMDDCNFLYMRRIGGFEYLEEFLKSAISNGKIFITSWNLYSWNYLDEVINVGRYFPVQIKLPKFTTDQIKECILSNYKEKEIRFEEDVEFEKEKVIEPKKYAFLIKPLEKTINIPYFTINYSLLKIRLLKRKERVEIEDIIFEKIHHVSNGNPGVAKIIWQKSLEYPVIKPSKIKDESFNIDLDYNESFVLNIILSMKSIKNDELSEIMGPDYQVDRIIYRLSKQGLVGSKEGFYFIKPEALKSIVEFQKKLRLVW